MRAMIKLGILERRLGITLLFLLQNKTIQNAFLLLYCKKECKPWREMSDASDTSSWCFNMCLSSMIFWKIKRLVDIKAVSAVKRYFRIHWMKKLWTAQTSETINLYVMRMLAYDSMVSLTELARQYSNEPSEYVFQSWVCNRNTLKFLRQWENDMNKYFR